MKAAVEVKEVKANPGKELEEAWVKYVEKLFELREAWDRFRKLRTTSSVRALEPQVQRLLARVSHRASFENALEALMGYWRVSGGMEKLRIKNLKEKKDG